MLNLAWLITGGFAKGYRTQILGITTALSTIALWAVGDKSLADLIAKGTRDIRRSWPCRARRKG